jgi:hypothetical protein
MVKQTNPPKWMESAGLTWLFHTINLLRKASWRTRFILFARAVPLYVATTVAIAIIEHFFSKYLNQLNDIIGTYSTKIVVILIILFAGSGAFLFKKSRQDWYGFVEVAFGIASAGTLAFGKQFVLASPDKWDEQVFRIGETVSHEESSAAPHRRSPTQTGQG